MVLRLVVVALLASISYVAHAATAPTIEGDGESLYVNAKDMLLQLDGADAVSMVDLLAKMADMNQVIVDLKERLAAVESKDFDDFATEVEVNVAIDAAATGLQTEIFADTDAKSAATNARVDQLVKDLAGFDSTKATVAELAKDIKYVLSHAANVTACAEDGTVHSGDGECVDPIPSCPKPDTPSNEGTMTLSSEFIIPGVTAKYACPKDGTFLKGPEVRSCSEKTAEFTENAPECLECEVVNCELCAGAPDTCGTCAYGHDLSADKTSCDERKDTIIVLEGGIPNARHNYNSLQMMAPNAGAWSNLLPNMPFSATNGAGALIKGTIYVVNVDYRTNSGVYYKLEQGSRSWKTFPTMGGNGKDVTAMSFYGTVNGISSKADGFYIFSRSASAVYKPDDDAWTLLPMHSEDQPRSRGATVVIKNLIYLIGGYADNSRQISDTVDIFDTSSGKFSAGVAMTGARCNHGAATYDGKIFVFGGSETTTGMNVAIDTVEVFDPSSGKWSSKTAMPAPWAEMSTGQLPVFASGEVMIPYSYRNDRSVANSLKYDTVEDTWTEGAKMIRPVGRYVSLMGSRD